MDRGEARPWRVALAGAGWVSAHHLAGWAKVPGARVVGIADPDPARARARATAFGVEAVFADTADMLDALRPDALDVCAPPAVHAELCALAAHRGIATSCQKPLAPTLTEARAVVALARGRMRLMVHENWRFRAPYRQVDAWLRGGAIGELTNFRLRAASSGLLPDAQGQRPALTRQPLLARLPRLAVGELLVHHLDVARWLLGELAVERARLTRACPAVVGDDSAVIALVRADGMPVEVAGSFNDPDAGDAVRDTLAVEGTRGRIDFDGTTLTLSGTQQATLAFDPADVYEGSYAAAIAHFARAVRDGTDFETPGDEHLRTLALVEDAYRLAGACR